MYINIFFIVLSLGIPDLNEAPKTNKQTITQRKQERREELFIPPDDKLDFHLIMKTCFSPKQMLAS